MARRTRWGIPIFALLAGVLLSIAPIPKAEAAVTPCPTTTCVLATSFFRIGNGSENSINSAGFLQQPWYWSSSASAWRQYTFSTGAYQTAYGFGASGGTAWNGNTFATNPIGTVTFDFSNFTVTSTSGSVSTGYGTVTATNTVTINSVSFTIKQDFILGQTSRFLKVIISVTNNSASTAVNFNQWVGPSDDYVGGCDTNTKDRGHIAVDTFTILSTATAANQNAVRVTCSGVAETEYLTSPLAGAKTIIPTGRFAGVPTGNPTTTTLISETSDNGYGLQIPLGDIPANGTKTGVWYLAGAANADLTSSVFAAIAAPLAPSVSSMTPNTTLNNSGNFTYSIAFSGSVTGLTTGDFSFSGTGSSTCTANSLTGSGANYTLSVTGCSEGLVVATLGANTVVDASSSAGPATSYSTNSVRVDQSSPTISSVSATNGNYSSLLNPNMNFVVSFSESVTISGVPRLQLTIGSTVRYANFLSMFDSRTANFRFTVSVDYNDIDLDGISIQPAMDPNSGNISDLATNNMTNFEFTPPTTSGVNVFQPPNAPTIDSITSGNSNLIINFTPGSSNGAIVTNYKYSINGGGFTALSPVDTITPLVITGLTNGTTYVVQIRAVSNLGDGLTSNQVSAAPSGFAIVSVGLSASASSVVKGNVIIFSATVNQPGVVTFFWNGERIPGCIRKAATTSASCNWKPAVQGQWTINALLDPTDPTYFDTYSPSIPVIVTKRSGLR